jgi:hypothetical protein
MLRASPPPHLQMALLIKFCSKITQILLLSDIDGPFCSGHFNPFKRAWMALHPPVHHPKKLVMGFHGWYEMSSKGLITWSVIEISFNFIFFHNLFSQFLISPLGLPFYLNCSLTNLNPTILPIHLPHIPLAIIPSPIGWTFGFREFRAWRVESLELEK